MRSKDDILCDSNLTLVECARELEDNGYKSSTGKKYSDVQVWREKGALGIDTCANRAIDKSLADYADVVKVIEDFSDMSYSEMAKQLNDLGFKTRQGSAFSYKQVQRILERIEKLRRKEMTDLVVRTQRVLGYIEDEKRGIEVSLVEKQHQRENMGKTFRAGRDEPRKVERLNVLTAIEERLKK